MTTPARESIDIPVSMLLLADVLPEHWRVSPTETLHRTPETEALFAQIDELINLRTVIVAPTPERPLSEFTCAVGVDSKPFVPPRVRAERVDGLEDFTYRVNVACTYTPNPRLYLQPCTYRWHIWRLGDPAPEVISQLGLEVRS